MWKKDKQTVNTNLILLLLGRVISDMGTGIQMVIMPLYIIDAGGSAATVGVFSFLSLVPVLIAYPFAGVIGDRLNRKTIMVATDLASAVVILGLALSAHSNKMSLTLLLSVQVMVSLLNGLFDPATKGMLPQLVAEDELTRANSTVASLRTLSGLLSPVIGAALYASLGIAVLFFINGISFLLSGSCSMLIRYKHIKRESAVGMPGFITDLSEGIRFILANKVIRKLCVFFLVIYALIQPMFTVVLPLFFRIRLEFTDTQYGYLQMVIILGALVGSILVGVLFGKKDEVNKPLIIGCSMLMVTMLMFSGLTFPHSLSVIGKDTLLYFALLGGVLCLLSTAIMFIHVPVQTYIQKATPNEYMSRMFSIVGMISKGGMPFGALVYGIILNRIEVHWTVMSATLLIMLISIVFLKNNRVVSTQ
ncbi:major facilitator superfamily MFS_1 [Desulforamulus ruminis DSM 2154]|uniref:Major facilitator superfamily MFS_1 n=1 Tax=Desulforamulus ruminis (strain ATCC 23193 / DSM 2154 / NCIMB 8452 / DL) TaxID=696281 RepID=F6DVF3_DESRL|nr:major facilitator superfamily MFS_1 [Desulforamulus ruminis DSM 2154]